MVDNKYWFVFYTKPNQERKARIYLNNISIENYLASIIKNKKWSDRFVKKEVILIKNYIFARCTQKERILVLQCPAILKSLYDNGKIAIVPDWQMINLQLFLSKITDATVEFKQFEGKKILIKEGPLAGVTGTITKKLNGNFFSVSIDSLNITIKVVVSEEDIKCVEDII